MQPSPPGRDSRAATRDNIRLIGQLSTVGLSFVVAIVLGFGGGYFLDNWLGTRPWLTLIGFACGLAAGVVNVYRVLQMSNRMTRGDSLNAPPEA